MRQKGFATLEVILMVVVIGILASIAVPRFDNISAKANTAKIQADLSTINTAIAVYQLEKGDDPKDIKTHLADNGYLQAEPKPPSGKCYIKGTLTPITGTEYTIQEKSGNIEAHLGTNTAEEFYVTNENTGNSNPSLPGT